MLAASGLLAFCQRVVSVMSRWGYDGDTMGLRRGYDGNQGNSALSSVLRAHVQSAQKTGCFPAVARELNPVDFRRRPGTSCPAAAGASAAQDPMHLVTCLQHSKAVAAPRGANHGRYVVPIVPRGWAAALRTMGFPLAVGLAWGLGLFSCVTVEAAGPVILRVAPDGNDALPSVHV